MPVIPSRFVRIICSSEGQSIYHDRTHIDSYKKLPKTMIAIADGRSNIKEAAEKSEEDEWGKANPDSYASFLVIVVITLWLLLQLKLVCMSARSKRGLLHLSPV